MISRNTQYTAKGHALKFQHKGGERQEFLVRKKTGPLVELEEVGTGARCVRHEGSLKIMPKVFPPDDASLRDPNDQDLPADVNELLQQSVGNQLMKPDMPPLAGPSSWKVLHGEWCMR